jgi:transcriptional regulator with XRE-family HTH domain
MLNYKVVEYGGASLSEIRRIRTLRGYSQRELALRSGIDPVTISRLETGTHEPRPATLRKLAQALDVEISDFFPREAPLPKAPAPLSLPSLDRSTEQRRLLFQVQTAMWDKDVREICREMEENPSKRKARVLLIAARKIYEELDDIGVIDELNKLSTLKSDELTDEDIHAQRVVNDLLDVMRKGDDIVGGRTGAPEQGSRDLGHTEAGAS